MTNSQVHKYDTRTAGNYRIHSCRTNIEKFTIQGPRVWNCLPASTTNLSSFSAFKNKVPEFFIKIVSELVSAALLRSPYLVLFCDVEVASPISLVVY